MLETFLSYNFTQRNHISVFKVSSSYAKVQDIYRFCRKVVAPSLIYNAYGDEFKYRRKVDDSRFPLHHYYFLFPVSKPRYNNEGQLSWGLQHKQPIVIRLPLDLWPFEKYFRTDQQYSFIWKATCHFFKSGLQSHCKPYIWSCKWTQRIIWERLICVRVWAIDTK